MADGCGSVYTDGACLLDFVGLHVEYSVSFHVWGEAKKFHWSSFGKLGVSFVDFKEARCAKHIDSLIVGFSSMLVFKRGWFVGCAWKCVPDMSRVSNSKWPIFLR